MVLPALVGLIMTMQCSEAAHWMASQSRWRWCCSRKGSRKESGSRPGVLDADLLEIVRDRLRNFQAGEFSCRENACALTHIEEALMWLNRRVDDRIERNVLGTTIK